MKSIKVKTFIPIFNDFYANHPVTPVPVPSSETVSAKRGRNPKSIGNIKLPQPPYHCTMAGPFRLE
jgi:hypothetical protein